MIIGQIKNGIVLDHITAGRGMEIYKILNLDKLNCTVAMIERAVSPKMGRKDIIKVDQLIDLDFDVLESKGIPYVEVRSMEEAMPELDILYMTRVQRERFFNEEDYLRLKDTYILTPDKLETAKSDMCILHPLPRVNEISVAVDDDPRACYFKQVLNGKYMRMALILKLLEVEV